jgi:hypothetical protein
MLQVAVQKRQLRYALEYENAHIVDHRIQEVSIPEIFQL